MTKSYSVAGRAKKSSTITPLVSGKRRSKPLEAVRPDIFMVEEVEEDDRQGFRRWHLIPNSLMVLIASHPRLSVGIDGESSLKFGFEAFWYENTSTRIQQAS